MNSCDMNDVIPACVMETAFRFEEDFKRKAEEERKAHIEQNIKNSGIIRKINNILREEGQISITLASTNEKPDINGSYWMLDSSDWLPQYRLIPKVTNRELFDYIINAYRKAGYKIGGWGQYSATYWKDEERIIYAIANCETCEI